MQKRSCLFIGAAAVILIALTVCGSVWDLKIAHAVYLGQSPSENVFGVLFSFIGILPTFVGWSFLGAAIACLSQKQVEDTKKRRRFMVFAILLFTLSFFYFCNTLYMANANAVKIPFVVAYGIGIAVILAAAFLGYKLAERSEDRELLQKVLFLAVVSLVTLLIVSSTKKIMCRPRFRFLLATDHIDYFRSWWQSGRGLKASLGLGAASDEFASLPSGHSAYSMFAVFLFPVFGDFVGKLRKYKPLLFALGFLWWAVTAFSRLTVGAHYLTDVTIGGLVTVLAYGAVTLAKRIYEKRKTKQT